MSSNTTRKADALGDRIREASVRLFNSRGYGSTTVDDIAAAAGVGVGSLYRRWPDKPALANDVVARIVASLTDLLATRSPGGTSEERFLELSERIWRFALEHPDEFVFVEGHTLDAFLDDGNRARKDALARAGVSQFQAMGVSAPIELVFSMIAGTIVHALRNGIPVDPDDASRRLWRALE